MRNYKSWGKSIYCAVSAFALLALQPSFAFASAKCSFEPGTWSELACDGSAFNAGLPNILEIGDSVSVFAFPFLQADLNGAANVCHVFANAGGSDLGKTCVGYWLMETAPGVKWNIVLFNFGLHDMELNAKGVPAVSLTEYQNNLKAIIAQIQAAGAAPIWISTTPIPNAILKYYADPKPYATSAWAQMQTSSIQVIDTNSMVLPFNATQHIDYTSGPKKGEPSPHWTLPVDALIARTISGAVLGEAEFAGFKATR